MFSFAIMFPSSSRLMWLIVFSVSFQLLKLASWQRQLPRITVKADLFFPSSSVIHACPGALRSVEAMIFPGILQQFCHSSQLDTAAESYPVVKKKGRQHTGTWQPWWRSSKKWNMMIHFLLNTWQGAHMEAAVGISPVAADGRGSHSSGETL